MQRVAITGVGIVSCLGADDRAVSDSLRLGRSGIVVDPERIERGFRSPLTARIAEHDQTGGLTRKQRKTMPDFGLRAYIAAKQSLEMAGLAPGEIQDERTGLVFGCDSSCLAAIEQVELLRERGATTSLGSGLVFRTMNSVVTMNLNTILGTRGACWSLSSACSSGGHAVGQAADLIRLGRQDRVICGGAQEVNWESMCSFDGIGAFSVRTGEPEAASRPFDADRDGLVPGGGAAAVLLERWDLAEARGARILGEVAGYGFSSDGGHISVPSDEGLARAMKMALETGSLSPGDVDYVCAHATSTPSGDRAEAVNILSVFGDDTPPVSSLKSMTGHELWMAGAAQVVYCTLMARDGFVAPNVNYGRGDEVTSRLNVVAETMPRGPRNVLANSAGFGGTNACLALRF